MVKTASLVQPATPPTSAECRDVIAGLRDQHAKLVAHGAEIAGQREQLAGLALIDRDPEASSRLQDLTVETTRIAVDQGNLEAAIKAAETRLKAALAREAAAAEVVKAHRVREILRARQVLAQQAEEALATFNAAMEQMVHIGRELQRCTDKATGDKHVGMVLRAAQQSARVALWQKGLIGSEPLPREELRAPLSEMIRHLDQAAARWADVTIDGEAPKEKAA